MEIDKTARDNQFILGATATLLMFTGLNISLVGCRRLYNNVSQQGQNLITPNQQNDNLNVVFSDEDDSADLKIVFPSRGNSTDLQNQANAIAGFLSQELGISVKAIIANDMNAVEALKVNQADVAFLGSYTALKAEQLANARLYLAEVHPGYSGRHSYHSVFVVRNNSPLLPKASAKQTLAQFQGKKIAFTSPISNSGFIFPVSELVKQGLVPGRSQLNSFFSRVTYEQDYSKALLAVLYGEADVAAVPEYSLQAPYIIAEQAKQLRVIYSVPGVPAHGIAIDDDVLPATREKIIAALLKLNHAQNNHLLRNLNNSVALVRIDHHHHLKPTHQALKLVGIKP